ncbi:helix-turn-helix transcriptional regulator [Amycolatopsis sp. NPDC059657]|uniref:helix-turn-helix transcriptional regulator n=1 Tax=Amycolatopsis sp. NPDC059657 TaxID=3346899 RepID=UPI003671B2EE
MLETSARLLRLLSLLETRRDWTGPQLADRLEVTTRTIRNDIERLRSLGYPVEAAPGVTGGYRLGAGASLPPLLLDDDEAVAVAIGLRTAAGGTVAGMEETSVRALAKLERLLPSRLRHRVGVLTSTVVTLPRRGPEVDPSVLVAIASACRDHERLRFDYRTHDREDSRRVTEPHRLVNNAGRWYLLAWDLTREDWRTFRVDRITPKLPAGPRFTPREMPDEQVGERVASGVAVATWRYQARVRVDAPAAHVSAWLPVATVEAIDARTCVLTAGSDTPEMLAFHLGLLDADFHVDPAEAPELAAYLEKLAARCAASVKGS